MAKRKKKVSTEVLDETSTGVDTATLPEAEHDIPVPHDYYDHVYVIHDAEGNEELVDHDGNPVKLNDDNEPIYDDDGMPKVRKRRGKQATGEKKPRSRKVRIEPLSHQQRFLLLRHKGVLLGSRLMLHDGSFVRPYNPWFLPLVGSTNKADKQIKESLGKLKKTDKKHLLEMVEAHDKLVNYFYGSKPNFVVTLLETGTEGNEVPAIGFAETHKGISLNVARKLLKE